MADQDEVNTYEIELLHPDGTRKAARVEFIEASAECRLKLLSEGIECAAVDSDCFEAFCTIRSQLLERGILPLCYASSRNVYPSEMARQMGSGLKAYRMSNGTPARISDLVRIFDSGPDIEPVSPAEQRAFFEQWLKSVMTRSK